MNHQSWIGVNNPYYGYGSMLKGFLDGAPADVVFNPKASVEVYMGVPHVKNGWWDGTHRACFTMWETDKLPDNFVRWLGQYDQIFVPCEHNRELFSQHHDSVTSVPLGIDPKFWVAGQPTDGPFRFHTGGSMWNRKGLQIVVEAFRKLGIPNTELHIKAAPHARDVPERGFPPGVFLHRNWMNPETQLAWFQQGHVFVAPSRGEGFGLMPLQAMACGIPTIMSDTSGHREFQHLATGVVPTVKVDSPYGGRWDEADVDALVELMRDHHASWDTHRQKALNTVRQVRKFSWAKASRNLLAALPEGHLLTTDRFVEPQVMVEATFCRNVKANIGKHHYRFKKGETAMLTEGVHQVLYDAGAIE